MSRVRTLLMSMLLIAATAGLPAVANAGTRSDTTTFHGATAYHSMIYATRSCGSTAYKIQSTQYRFYRSSTDRGARVTDYRTGIGAGPDCSGTLLAPRGSQYGDHDACFGCNGNGPKWSRTYLYSHNYPYIRNASWAFAYSKLTYRVYLPYSGGRSYYSGSRCSNIALWGGSQC